MNEVIILILLIFSVLFTAAMAISRFYIKKNGFAIMWTAIFVYNVIQLIGYLSER